MQLHIPAHVSDPLAQGQAVLKGDHGIVRIPYAKAQSAHAGLVQAEQLSVRHLAVHNRDAATAFLSELFNGVYQTGIIQREGLGLHEYGAGQGKLVRQLAVGCYRSDLSGRLAVVRKGGVDDMKMRVAGVCRHRKRQSRHRKTLLILLILCSS